jgi:hypothetical protein
MITIDQSKKDDERRKNVHKQTNYKKAEMSVHPHPQKPGFAFAFTSPPPLTLPLS